jgi:hypothetical protein
LSISLIVAPAAHRMADGDLFDKWPPRGVAKAVGSAAKNAAAILEADRDAKKETLRPWSSAVG